MVPDMLAPEPARERVGTRVLVVRERDYECVYSVDSVYLCV